MCAIIVHGYLQQNIWLIYLYLLSLLFTVLLTSYYNKACTAHCTTHFFAHKVEPCTFNCSEQFTVHNPRPRTAHCSAHFNAHNVESCTVDSNVLLKFVNPARLTALHIFLLTILIPVLLNAEFHELAYLFQLLD